MSSFWLTTWKLFCLHLKSFPHFQNFICNSSPPPKAFWRYSYTFLTPIDINMKYTVSFRCHVIPIVQGFSLYEQCSATLLQRSWYKLILIKIHYTLLIWRFMSFFLFQEIFSYYAFKVVLWHSLSFLLTEPLLVDHGGPLKFTSTFLTWRQNLGQWSDWQDHYSEGHRERLTGCTREAW